MKSSAPASPLALAFGGLVALAVAMGIGRFVYTPILPPMAEALGMSQGTAGLIASANFVGYLVGALLAAQAWLPGSRRRWLLGGLATSAATTAAMAFAGTLPVFLALRFVGGVASAFVLVFASAVILDRLAAAGRPGLASVHFAGVGGGIAFSAALVGLLLGFGADWRALWLACGVVALAAVALVARLVPGCDDPPVPARPPGSRPDPLLRRLTIAYGLFGFGYVITATFLVAIVRGNAEVRALEPFVWLVVGLTAAPSVALWTALGARLGVMRTFALACVLEAIGVAVSVLWISGAGVLLAAALLGGTFMGITALGLVGARRLAHGDPRSTLAVMTSAFGLGQIVGPSFAGLVHDATGSFLLPSLTAAAALLVAAGLVVVRGAAARPG